MTHKPSPVSKRLELIAQRIRKRHGLSGPTARALAEIHFNQGSAK